MIVLGIETSCDETGLALYDTAPLEGKRPAVLGIIGQALHSQIAMHHDYGGVVPELASRDHIRRILPLLEQTLGQAKLGLKSIDAVAYTQGPGLAGALLVGSAFGQSLAQSLSKPALGIHHLEGHLLSPLLGDESDGVPHFPFVALLVSGGHTQLMLVSGVGQYQLLGETLDDAVGEAFDKTASLLGLGYPGGAAVSQLAAKGKAGRFNLPRPMLHSGDLDFSFSGLKTAVLNQIKQHSQFESAIAEDVFRADLAFAFVEAAVSVLVSKTTKAVQQTACQDLVLAGGVAANIQLRNAMKNQAQKAGFQVFYPPQELCTDNGVMIAFAGALRLLKQSPLAALTQLPGAFDVRPRWSLAQHK
ncbi:QRI7 Metal-dependent proteases with possible chaperone activity [Burkholderiaceae bacterium]|jgi:N6-L-threonylcarbamoyladenine synthase